MTYNEFIKPFILQYLDGAKLRIRFSSEKNKPAYFDQINSLAGFVMPAIPKPTKVEIVVQSKTAPFRLWLDCHGNVFALNRACDETEMEVKLSDDFVQWLEERRVVWTESTPAVWEELDD